MFQSRTDINIRCWRKDKISVCEYRLLAYYIDMCRENIRRNRS